MQSAIFDTPVLKVPSLKTKFDTIVVSNSFVALFGDYLEARIVQQLHFWCYSEYGVVINNIRWIYKPIREWLSEVLIGFSNWQLRTAIASLVKKGILLKEHLFKEHHGHNFSPKNRTYYYSLNYEELEKLFQKYETAETIENVRFVSPTKRFCESSEKQFCGVPQNRSKNTSIKNSSKDQSHPHLPCVSQTKKEDDQDKKVSSNRSLLKFKEVNSVNFPNIEQDINPERVEQKINTNNSAVQNDVQVAEITPKPKSKTPKGTKPKRKRKNDAPWKDQGQFKRFYRALIQALPIVANARSPQGLAQVIIRQLRSGIPHTYWDDFIAGLPIGTSTKPEWEIEPSVPYPMFVEYLMEKIKRGDNTASDEQTRNEVFRILSQPRQAKAFWGQFKRSVVNVSKAVERDRALGVSNPHTPVWTRERIEPSISEAAAAGDKIMAINGAVQSAIEAAKTPQLESESVSPTPDPWTDEEEGDTSQPSMRELLTERLGGRNLKGFVKAMPQVSKSEVDAEERKAMKPKTNISQMSVAEINDYLSDSVLRKQIMSQLWHSDYELITNELGEIIAIKRSP